MGTTMLRLAGADDLIDHELGEDWGHSAPWETESLKWYTLLQAVH